MQELIRATFGDRLSYKIVNYMNKMTTSEQIAEYLESTMYEPLIFAKIYITYATSIIA